MNHLISRGARSVMRQLALAGLEFDADAVVVGGISESSDATGVDGDHTRAPESPALDAASLIMGASVALGSHGRC